jgi:hypothetical protein
MILATLLLLAQAAPWPSSCPPTPVKRIQSDGTEERAWHSNHRLGNWIDVQVDVSADGTVKSATVKRSFSADRDAQVVNEALKSKYKPATVNCEAVEGTYDLWVLLVNV